MRPQVGFAAVKLLEEAGCRVEVPQAQACCGQPAFNSGDDRMARAIARQVVDVFEGFDYVVVPSGSCAGMLSTNLPKLLASDPEYAARVRELSGKTFEITSFLVDILNHSPKPPPFAVSATYHDSCSGLRELGIAAQPRQLLDSVDDLEMMPLEDNDVCCGFGGTFCVKFPEISDAIVTAKVEAVERSGAEVLLAGDLGCLLNMAGKLSRRGSSVRCYHTIELLAGTEDNGIIEV